MKIYISGQITGLPLPDVRHRFEDAESFLDEIGFDVVNPMKNGLEQDATWNEHMVRDIALLLPCDAIYMLDNWINSTGAQIEYDTAMRTKKDIWFESNVQRVNRDVMRIQNAIHEATGLRFTEYATKSRKRAYVDARMIFVFHCRRLKMTLTEISKHHIRQTHSALLHALRKYDANYKFDTQFRALADKVNNILIAK